MRSSFITLTFAVVCLLGSSLASPVYDKRALGSIGQGAGQGVGSIVSRSVPSDGDSVHLYKRRRILKKLLRGAGAFLKKNQPKPVSAKSAGANTASTVAKRDSSINPLSDGSLPTL